MARNENTAEDLMRRRRRRRRQMLGFVVCVLVLLGIGSLISSGSRLISRMFDDSDERAEYERRLTYVVMMDMLPFASLEQANQADLLESSIWAALFNEDSTLYDRNDLGALLLPSAEVDRYAAQLFGPDYQLRHGTFESQGMIFEYDGINGWYIIPVTGQIGNYTPRVVEISGSRSVQRVSVGYLAPYASANDFASNRDVNEPVKYYDYLFSRAADGNYYLVSMEESAWVAAEQPNIQPDIPYMPQQQDPNIIVGEATNDIDAAVAQELEDAQNAGEDSGKEDADGADASGEETGDEDTGADEADSDAESTDDE